MCSRRMWARYPYDKYDRLWSPAFSKGFDETAYINTTSLVNVSGTIDMVPEIVMQNVAYWPTYNLSYSPTASGLGSSSVPCYLALYFAEIDPRAVNESRVFDFVVNREISLGEANISIVNITGGVYRAYEIQKTHVMLNDTSTIELVRHTDSILGPILNGVELFQLTGKVGFRTFAADGEWVDPAFPPLPQISFVGSALHGINIVMHREPGQSLVSLDVKHIVKSIIKTFPA